ncbi:MAG: OsmC family protein [Bryobacteraceae bacterium]|nr:OsmC family protein [Bryobacterales bacterium]MEB2361051.1 OsmC family protein [Bryobacterales bacterium]NUN01116.1 OsmC family protein [Bryobacteraceae bacterium]
MDVTVRYRNGVQFQAETRGHSVICDQPSGNGGANEGMSPPEFLLVSLGTCAGYYAAQYLKARNLPMEGLEVRVRAAKDGKPVRLDSFVIEVTVPGVDGERHREGLLRATKACLIHNTLSHPPKIDIAIGFPLETAVQQL